MVDDNLTISLTQLRQIWKQMCQYTNPLHNLPLQWQQEMEQFLIELALCQISGIDYIPQQEQEIVIDKQQNIEKEVDVCQEPSESTQ